MITFFQILADGEMFGGGIKPPIENEYTEGVTQGENVLATLATVLSNIIGSLTILGGLFFVVYFFMGAFQWISAGGDSSKIEKARDQMIQGVLGLLVMVISYSLIGIISRVIGLDLINIEETIGNLVPGSQYVE